MTNKDGDIEIIEGKKYRYNAYKKCWNRIEEIGNIEDYNLILVIDKETLKKFKENWKIK